jgi:hypothetical protein
VGGVRRLQQVSHGAKLPFISSLLCLSVPMEDRPVSDHDYVQLLSIPTAPEHISLLRGMQVAPWGVRRVHRRGRGE